MNSKCARVLASLLTILSLTVTAPGSLWAQPQDSDDFPAKTPIKHIVVIFQENISFDHYFATYPHAMNPSGEPAFHPNDGTPRADNLLAGGLLDENPNSTQPFRLDRSQAVTCDQGHSYTPEQKAFDHGLMDKFPENTGSGGPGCVDAGKGTGVVMGYYDGNTVTALWNYAQHFAMSDNSFSTMFGPSTPGALSLVAGSTTNATAAAKTPAGGTAKLAGNVAGGVLSGTVIGDVRPGFDECVTTNPGLQTVTTATFSSQSKNVGDLLNAKGITWGWFQGGFIRTSLNGSGLAVCGSHHTGLAGDDAIETVGDYIPHHEPFQYYQSTANPHHNPPTPSLIGKDEAGVNHQYDLSQFWIAVAQGHLPAVSFLKAGAYQDGHAGYSDPLDEQTFVVQTINRLQASREWAETAVIIAYDDSDGWYDHVMDPIINQSSSANDDALTSPGSCGVTPALGQPGRCGYGPRQPLLVVSPWAKQNYIDHRITDQSSILRFIEDNWDLGRIGGDSSDVKAGTLNGLFDFDEHHDRADSLILDPSTGLALGQHHENAEFQFLELLKAFGF
jgi:phospholipase C